MCNLAKRIILLLILFEVNSGHVQASKETGRGIRGLVNDDLLLCQVIAIESMTSLKEEESEGEEKYDFKCLLEPHGIMYQLPLPEPFIRSHTHLASGNSIISIAGGRATFDGDSNEPAKIIYPEGAPIKVVSSGSRRLQEFRDRAHGTKSVLIVRVSFLDSNVTLNATFIGERVFGTGDNPPRRHVKSQFAECSFGKLNLIPAQGHGIVNGTVELQVSRNVTGLHRDLLENILTMETQAQLGDVHHSFDHIMFVVPKGSRRGGYDSRWVAYSVIGGQLTFYNDRNIGYYSVPMHELGHNFGLYHSSEGPFPYGDKTGLMGPSTQAIGSEFDGRCFNSHKHWLLGWYSDRAITVDVMNGAWGGRLVGFIHYDRATGDDVVVVKVGDLYLQYNRRNLFNFGTLELGDRVTIVRGSEPDEPSELLAGVAESVWVSPRVYRVDNFQDSGYDLVIEACDQVFGSRQSPELPDYVRMSIHLDGAAQTSTCDNVLSSMPSAAPSAMLSSAPSEIPSLSPSQAPVIHSEAPSASAFNIQTVTCEDSRTETVKLDDERGYRSCRWLSRAPAWQERLCVPENPAFDICEETCGKCNDSCEDSVTSFYVNRRHGAQNCEWLASRSGWQTHLCRDGHPANFLCKETCDTCSG